MNAPIPAARVEAHRVNELAKDRARVEQHRVVREGTAYTALRIVQREVLETALRYKRERWAWGDKAAQPYKIALFALLRVRREMRAAYPTAKPVWEQAA